LIVEKMVVHPASYRFKASFGISRGKIGAIGELAPHVLVSLRSSSGSQGWGECRPSNLWSYETKETVVTTLENYLRPCIEGHDPEDIPGLHRRMDAVIAGGITRGQPIAKSGIDIAAHDLICRAEGVSLFEFLGGLGQAKINLTYLVSASSEDEAANQVRLGKKKGFRGFKIKIGKGVERDLEIISACKEEAGGYMLWANANQAYHLQDAIKLSREAAKSDLQFLEQPLASTDRSGLIKLSRSSPVTVAIDESVFTDKDLVDFVSLGFEGAVVAKTAKSGGVFPARKMIEVARESGLEVLGSGLTEGMVGFSASAQLFAAAGLSHPVDLNGPQFIIDHLAAGPIVEGGTAVAGGPGLGVKIDVGGLRRGRKGGGRSSAHRSSC